MAFEDYLYSAEDDQYEDEYELDLDVDLGDTENYEDEAKHYLALFFANKQMYDGSLISADNLFAERNIQIMTRLNLEDCIPIFYSALEECGVDFEASRRLFVDELQVECARMRIPKFFLGGMLLVWLRLCKGLDL